MSNGLGRFAFYLNQVEGLLIKARKQKNAAMLLFGNNARTPFFMLEGLAKLYTGMHNAKKFIKLKEQFKWIEDGIGQIDYYNSLVETFQKNKKIPAECKEYFDSMMNQKSAQLNIVLVKKGWLSDDNKRIKKINNKLKEIDWLKPSEEVKAISEFYKSTIKNITRFVNKTGFRFNNVETDVHELRRKLRWLSIYPQALQGVFQYAPAFGISVHLEKYITKEIVESPFNKLPDVGNNTSVLLLNKNNFLALSWMIAELGSLKDEGLILTGLSEAIKQTSACTEEEALTKAYVLLGNKQRKIEQILDDAESITKTFFKENNLLHLIANTTI